MNHYALNNYQPVGNYGTYQMSPEKDYRSNSLRYLDKEKEFDSLIDTHNYQTYQEKIQQSLDQQQNSVGGQYSTFASTNATQNFVLKELELRCNEYQRLLKFNEEELNKTKLKLIDQKIYYEELMKEKDKRIEEYQIKEKQFYKQMMSNQGSQVMEQSQKDNQQSEGTNKEKQEISTKSNVGIRHHQSQKSIDSQIVSQQGSQTQSVDKFYKYDLTIKKLEVSLAQKDLDIANLSKEVNELKQTIDYKVHLEMKERQRKEGFESSMGQLPFVAENQDLKRQSTALKVENTKLKKGLKDTKAKLELYESQNSSLNYKINEYIQMEKLKLEEQYEKGGKNKESETIIKVSEDRNLLDGVMGIMQYIRQALCEIMFELFVRSGNIAFQRKTNSFTIFQVNMKEIFGPESRGFIIPLYLYKKMKTLVKLYYPDYGETATLDDQMYKVATGEDAKEVDRNQVNQWVLSSLQEIQRKSLRNKNTSKEQNHLFRFLALLYRTRYPLQGSSVEIDPDIMIKLEDSIVDTMLKLSIEEEEDE